MISIKKKLIKGDNFLIDHKYEIAIGVISLSVLFLGIFYKDDISEFVNGFFEKKEG